MVYDWESHKDILRGLYVDDKKPIEDIITHMRINHNFTPRYVRLPTRLILSISKQRLPCIRSSDDPGCH